MAYEHDQCELCGKNTDDTCEVVIEPGFKGDMGCPAYGPDTAWWCRWCATTRKHDHFGIMGEENPRERGEDDGVEYGDPRDVI